MKVAHVLRAARDQRGAGVLGEFHQGEFFRVVAQSRRFVEHPRALHLGTLEQMRGVKKLAVKRRVFAHHHRAQAVQSAHSAVLHPKPRVGTFLQHDVLHGRLHLATTAPRQVLGFAGPDGVAPALGLAHHHKGAVFVDFERRQRVGNK